MTTTPNDFLQFAKEMGLEQIKSTSLTNNNNNNNCTLTGLYVLNNLCHLIEQIHTLKAENNHLRANLDLVQHLDKFLLKKTEQKSIQNYDEDKSFTLSPSNSLKIKKHGSSMLSISSRERQGMDFLNNPDDSSSIMHMESEMTDSNLGLSTWNNWNKVRQALRFSLRRKFDQPSNSTLTIPAISISMENDDNHLHDQKKSKKNNNQKELIEGGEEDTDHDDESIESNRLCEKRRLYQTNDIHSSSNETNLIVPTISIDEENLLTRKQSKIAHYRRKLRSKLITVKKQFSDRNSSSTLRLHGSTFDDIKSGLNHALLTEKLAPAMTKSYQEKMRQWQTMQKSQFLVNYRRQSIAIKPEPLPITSFINEQPIQSIPKSIPEIKIHIPSLSPILSPNQRSLIAHQWKEIMSEEISLRYYNEYFQRKLQELKQLETDLKYLKTSIFCTNKQEYLLKHRSMTSLEQLDQDLLDQYRQIYLPRRCRSLQTLISMPASWILAVQSAAYSDILDGTSKKITDQTIIFNKKFFNQLNHFKKNRMHFEEDTFKKFSILTNSKINLSYDENLNEKRVNRLRSRIILTRGFLRKSSLISPKEFFPKNPMIPLQKFETSSHIDLLTTTETTELNLSHNKHLKQRSRFDLKKTLQRSKSICMTQFNSWLQRRRQQQQHSFIPRRKSAFESKTTKDTLSSSCSTPKLLGSPRLARLHQKIFKQHSPPPPPTPITDFPLLPSPSKISDDSDQYFKKQETPVRIYLPARTSPSVRHVRILNTEIQTPPPPPPPPMLKITSPIINRRNISKERRDSFVALSNILNDQ